MSTTGNKGGSNFFLKAAIVVVIIFSLVMIVQLQLEFNDLSDQREGLSMEIDRLTERIAELNYQLTMPFDDDYIIRTARRRLNLRMPNEIVFINDIRD